MTQPFDYHDKTVFIAGGTSGINLGIAHCFAEAGASIGVLSRSAEKIEAAVTALKAHGGEVAGYSADVRDYAAVEAALQQARQQLGGFDVLVSGAAGNFPSPALGLSANAFKSVVDIDLNGSFHVLRAAYPLLNKPGASVINISAPQAFIPMEFQMHVCAAKAGVDMVTRVAAMEWGPAGVRVNAVVPGPIDNTEGMKRLAPTEQARKLTMNSVPLGRLGSVTEIGQACLWLGSPYAAYVSGAIIPVDGGWSLGGVAAMSAGMKAIFGKADT